MPETQGRLVTRSPRGRAADMAAAAAAADLPEPPPLALQEPPGEQQAASAAVPGGAGGLVAADGVGANLRTDGAAAAASASASVAAAVASDLGWVASRMLLPTASLHLNLGINCLSVKKLGIFRIRGTSSASAPDWAHSTAAHTLFPDPPSYGICDRPTVMWAINCSALETGVRSASRGHLAHEVL